MLNKINSVLCPQTSIQVYFIAVKCLRDSCGLWWLIVSSAHFAVRDICMICVVMWILILLSISELNKLATTVVVQLYYDFDPFYGDEFFYDPTCLLHATLPSASCLMLFSKYEHTNKLKSEWEASYLLNIHSSRLTCTSSSLYYLVELTCLYVIYVVKTSWTSEFKSFNSFFVDLWLKPNGRKSTKHKTLIWGWNNVVEP